MGTIKPFCQCTTPTIQRDYDPRDGNAVRLVCIYCGTDKWWLPPRKPIPPPEPFGTPPGGDNKALALDTHEGIIREWRAGKGYAALAQSWGVSEYLVRRAIKQEFER